MSALDPLMALRPAALHDAKAYTVPPVPPPVKLDANESPYALSESARKELAERLARIDLHRYPDGGMERLREALAQRFGGAADEYVIGCGSDEIISILYLAFAAARPGAEAPRVLFPEPTFVMYRVSATTHGWDSVGVPLTGDFALDEAALDTELGASRPNLAFYATPNNPTGGVFDDGVMSRLAERHPGTLHIVDEAYGAFAEADRRAWVPARANIGLLGTLSKIGLAALRVGWVRLHPALAYELQKTRQPFNVNQLAQETALFVLNDAWDEISAQIDAIKAERTRLEAALASRGSFTTFPTEANFVFLRVDEGDSLALAASLRERGVGIRAFKGYGPRLDGHLRVTVGTPQENDALLEALDALGVR